MNKEWALSLASIALLAACFFYLAFCPEQEKWWVVFLIVLPLALAWVWRSSIESSTWKALIGIYQIVSFIAVGTYTAMIRGGDFASLSRTTPWGEFWAHAIVVLSVATIPICIYFGALDLTAEDKHLGRRWGLPGHLLPALGLAVVLLLLVANSLALSLAIMDQTSRLKGKGPALSALKVATTEGPLKYGDWEKICGAENPYDDFQVVFEDPEINPAENPAIQNTEDYRKICQGDTRAATCVMTDIIRAIRCTPAGKDVWITLAGGSPDDARQLALLERRRSRLRELIWKKLVESFKKKPLGDQIQEVEWLEAFRDLPDLKDKKDKKEKEFRDLIRRTIFVRVTPSVRSLKPVSYETLTDSPDLLDYFYFMIYSITTTGYGDIKPATPFAKFVASLANLYEVFFLIILVNLVVARSFAKDAACRYSHHGECPVLQETALRPMPVLPPPNKGEPGVVDRPGNTGP